MIGLLKGYLYIKKVDKYCMHVVPAIEKYWNRIKGQEGDYTRLCHFASQLVSITLASSPYPHDSDIVKVATCDMINKAGIHFLLKDYEYHIEQEPISE